MVETLRVLPFPRSADPERKTRAPGRRVVRTSFGMGGEAELVDTPTFPLVSRVRASSSRRAPTVLCYGHFDVKPPEPLDAWESDRFEPTVRMLLYARGVADDKVQLYTLLKAAETLPKLASCRSTPVRLRRRGGGRPPDRRGSSKRTSAGSDAGRHLRLRDASAGAPSSRPRPEGSSLPCPLRTGSGTSLGVFGGAGLTRTTHS